MSHQEKTSPWVYLGIGCGVILVIGIAAMAVLGFLSYRFAKDLTEGFTDPQVREERIRTLLGTDELPDGYHAAISLSIPMVLDLAVLSDRAPDPRGNIDGFDSRGFIFLKITDFGAQRRELLDFLEGRSEEFRLLQESPVGMDWHEFVGRGRFEIGGNEAIYASYRADIEIERKKLAGLATLFTVDCPDRGKVPLGIWFGPDPAASRELQELDLTGTPADEFTLQGFLAQFALCGVTGG